MLARVSESTINAIARRTTRLIEMIERATQSSPDKLVRDGGSQLVELLTERIEEIRELHGNEDEELIDKMKVFLIRLKLAEEKILGWPMPALPKKPKAERAPRRPRKRAHAA